VGPDGQRHPCYQVHRALLGSLERFLAGLVEHYGGAFPTWLAPVQVKVLPIAERHLPYARAVEAELRACGTRVEVDDRRETISLKVREAQLLKIPYTLIVGDREQEAGTVSVRERARGDVGAVPRAQFVECLILELHPPAPAGHD
jgi:threonyl-tRNA synthetase